MDRKKENLLPPYPKQLVVRHFEYEARVMDRDVLARVARSLRIQFEENHDHTHVLSGITALQGGDRSIRIPEKVFKAMRKALEIHEDRTPHLGCTVNH